MTKPILNRVETESPVAPARTEPSVAPPPPQPEVPRSRRRLRLTGALVAAVIVLGAGVWGLRARHGARLRQATGEALPTFAVWPHDFVRTLRLHGVVEAAQSYTVSAPRLAGSSLGMLTITKLVATGAAVKKGGLLVEFDRQDEIKKALDQQATYRDFEDQIKKEKADQAAALAKDQSELKAAEDAVESARLDTLKNEVVSRVDAEKNQEALEEAQANLKQLRATFDLKRVAAQAKLRLLEIQRDSARSAMRHAQENSERMTTHAPMNGLVVLNTIWKGGRMAEVQEGDQVRPGVPFLQVVDPRAMLVRARINQADASLLSVGQRVQVRLDAYPELVFPGKVEQVAAIGVTSGLSDKVRTFNATFAITGTDPKLMPDLSAAVDVELERRDNVLTVPRDALLEESGRAWVDVKNGSGFEKRAVKLAVAGDVDVVVESGLKGGDVVLRNASGARNNGKTL